MSVEPKQKVRYNYEFLKKYCEENNIVLLKDYSNEKVNSNTKIEAKCINETCDEYVKKDFYKIVNNNSSLCKKCNAYFISEKRKKTCLEKYGVEFSSQSNIIKEKKKVILLEKYGVENISQLETTKNKKIKKSLEKYGTITPLQNKEVKEKIKQTCLEKYGVENPNQNKKIREKTKETCLEKYGVEYPSQTEEVRDKVKQTCLEKYGVENPTQNKEIREKTKQTCLEKYGVEFPSQTEEVKKKMKQTFLEKYGVEHPNQNSEIMDKCSKNAYKLKDYILPSGNIIKVQGYEHYAYDELLNIENINEEDIINGVSNVPEIWYKTEDKERRHYVDIYIPSQNRCIEVKSTWTAEKKQDNIFLKQEAGKELGYNYEIWVYNGKGEKVECYK